MYSSGAQSSCERLLTTAGTNSTRKPVVNTFFRTVCIVTVPRCGAPVPGHYGTERESVSVRTGTDDHDDKRLLHYASLHPSIVHIELSTLFKAKSGSPFTDDPTAGLSCYVYK
jgi:hypothetical protein